MFFYLFPRFSQTLHIEANHSRISLSCKECYLKSIIRMGQDFRFTMCLKIANICEFLADRTKLSGARS